MIRIQIDGKIYEVKEGRNLLETCIALGIDVPYFCYHGALGSVGACRQCAVKKYAKPDDKTGKITMSCMEPVTDGMMISVNDPEVADFREGVVEGLMTNHPHDCPVCDEGGECHLQDMTVMTGHNYRRFIFKKRTYISQYLGPFVHHEMNRCIQCYRCVRYYRDYAGGKDLNVFGSANKVYFGRENDGILESEFAGNLVEVCPTGVFTDATLQQHYTRKWDLTNTPSVCVHCSVGCNTILSERYGTLRRTLSRYHADINGYFLCDRGRFGYEFASSGDRLKKILFRPSRTEMPLETESLNRLQGLSDSLQSKNIIGIGSPRASLEANYALLKLAGKENFYHGLSARDHQLVNAGIDLMNNSRVHIATLKEMEQADAVLVLGEDVTQTAPMMALSLRQSIRNKSINEAAGLGIPLWNDAAVRQLNHHIRSPFYIISPYPTKLDDIATATWYCPPEDMARAGNLAADYMNDPAAFDLEKDEVLKNFISAVVASLRDAERPLIVTGTGSRKVELLQAAGKIIDSLVAAGKKPALAVAFPESNSVGLALLPGEPLDAVLKKIENNPPEVLIILENDLYRRKERSQVERLFEKCRQVIVVDSLMNETTAKADLVLPSAIYAESEGTLVNYEGRIQRHYSVLPVHEPLKESWNRMIELMDLGNRNEKEWNSFDQVWESLAEEFPAFSVMKENMPDAGFRFYNEKIARQTARFSGRTAMNARVNVSEPAPPRDPDSPLKFSMEGYKGQPPTPLIPYYWAPGWNSEQAINKYLDAPGGRYRDGSAGIRIFPVARNSRRVPEMPVPQAFQAKQGELYLVPVYRIFGSEELSAHGRSLAELIPGPFVMMNDQTAGNTDNKTVTVLFGQEKIHAEVKIDNHIPDGMAAVSCQLPGMPFLDLPCWGKISQEI
jgi:NADH-quinone oxidoreductase subunit G